MFSNEVKLACNKSCKQIAIKKQQGSGFTGLFNTEEFSRITLHL